MRNQIIEVLRAARQHGEHRDEEDGDEVLDDEHPKADSALTAEARASVINALREHHVWARRIHRAPQP